MQNRKKQPSRMRPRLVREGDSSVAACGGIVLLVTLVVLAVLATLGYTVTIRVAAKRHRDNYIIDYQAARYACDSAVKYALSALEDINDMELVERPNEPDFSDLFALDELEYKDLLERWALEKAAMEEERERELADESRLTDGDDVNSLLNNLDIMKNDADLSAEDLAFLDRLDVNQMANDINAGRYAGGEETEDINAVIIRGPYGPEWPYVAEPTEFEVGTATVKIAIEDENAKYPLGWAVINDAKVTREAQASFETFCEWMDLSAGEIDRLKTEAEALAEVKPFKVAFQPITTRVQENVPAPAATGAAARRGRRPATTRPRYKTETVTPAQQMLKQGKDFAKLFHGSVIDMDLLARPTVISETRKESALKYTGTWGSASVNVNTAPRHVLEAAFTFGGDARQIAEAIIARRREKPFKGMADLKKELLAYSDSVSKCEQYITTVSDCFTIRVTARSGSASASAVAAVIKTGGKIQKVVVMSD